MIIPAKVTATTIHALTRGDWGRHDIRGQLIIRDSQGVLVHREMLESGVRG